jgi:hypothetical protein
VTPAHPTDREILALLGQYADDELVAEAARKYAAARRRLNRPRHRAHRRVARAISTFGACVAVGYVATILVLRFWGS